MTSLLDAATEELRPLIEEFIVWAAENSPDADADLIGPPALVHRVLLRENTGHWTRDDLREVLLTHLPGITEDPERTAEATLPTLGAYLTFLSESGRLTRKSHSLEDLLDELDKLEEDFADAFGDIDHDDAYGEPISFVARAEELAALPTIRLAPRADLAAAARRTPLLTRARDLAVRDDDNREGDERAWNLAAHVGFIERDDPPGWPDGPDDEVLDTWIAGLHEVAWSDLDLPDDESAFAELTREILIRLFVSDQPIPLEDLQVQITESVADDEAWKAAQRLYGDAFAEALGPVIDYGIAAMDGDRIALTPLGVAGVAHLIADDDVFVDVRPALESMTAAELIDLWTSGLSEDDAQQEWRGWRARRTPEEAAHELLTAAANEDHPVTRVTATKLVGELGAAAVPAWREVLTTPSLRAYATTNLSTLGVDDAPAGSRSDILWMFLDMWSISAELDDAEFLEALGPDSELIGMLDDVWRIRHPDLEVVLDLIGTLHPNKKAKKAARRALFKARSA